MQSVAKQQNKLLKVVKYMDPVYLDAIVKQILTSNEHLQYW